MNAQKHEKIVAKAWRICEAISSFLYKKDPETALQFSPRVDAMHESIVVALSQPRKRVRQEVPEPVVRPPPTRTYRVVAVRRHPKTGERLARALGLVGSLTHEEALRVRSKYTPKTYARYAISYEIEEEA